MPNTGLAAGISRRSSAAAGRGVAGAGNSRRKRPGNHRGKGRVIRCRGQVGDTRADGTAHAGCGYPCPGAGQFRRAGHSTRCAALRGSGEVRRHASAAVPGRRGRRRSPRGRPAGRRVRPGSPRALRRRPSGRVRSARPGVRRRLRRVRGPGARRGPRALPRNPARIPRPLRRRAGSGVRYSRFPRRARRGIRPAAGPATAAPPQSGGPGSTARRRRFPLLSRRHRSHVFRAFGRCAPHDGPNLSPKRGAVRIPVNTRPRSVPAVVVAFRRARRAGMRRWNRPDPPAPARGGTLP